MSLVIIDTECANLSSVRFAFNRLGANSEITQDPTRIERAQRVVLPGVGAAPHAMARIESLGLTDTIKSLTQPVLGICLGMQLLFDELHEGVGVTRGLGLIPGQVVKLDTHHHPTPHMGWNTMNVDAPSPLLAGVKSGAYAYFVHSYAAKIGPHTLASCDYGDKFSSVVSKKNVYGCQFHPERSSLVGAKILGNFLRL